LKSVDFVFFSMESFGSSISSGLLQSGPKLTS
jgi:hypothetical protein